MYYVVLSEATEEAFHDQNNINISAAEAINIHTKWNKYKQ